jgi:large subunit ribosomal protein L29
VKTKELRDLGGEGLQEKLKELHEEYFNLRFQTRLGEVNNPLRIQIVRRDMARIKTLLREVQLKNHGENKNK